LLQHLAGMSRDWPEIMMRANLHRSQSLQHCSLSHWSTTQTHTHTHTHTRTHTHTHAHTHTLHSVFCTNTLRLSLSLSLSLSPSLRPSLVFVLAPLFLF